MSSLILVKFWVKNIIPKLMILLFKWRKRQITWKIKLFNLIISENTHLVKKKKYQAYCHSFPEYIQYGSCRCHTVYANSIAGFPEYYTVYNIRLFLLFELFLINSKKIIHLKNTKQQRRAHTITVLLFYTQYIFTTQCKIIKNINIYIFT